MKKRTKLCKILDAVIMTIAILFIIWAVASWLNVGFNNYSSEAAKNIWSWNLFML